MKNLKYVAIFSFTFIVVFGALLFGLKPAKQTSGKQAPDFTITSYKDKKKITLSKLPKDKVIVLNFWASWCGPCREEAPALEEVWKKYKSKILFIGLNWKDTEENGKAFIKEFGITYPNGEVSDELANEYRLAGVPETFIVKNGQIYEHIIGAITVETLSEKIDSAL